MKRDLFLVSLALVTWGVGEGMFLYFEPIYLQQLGADPILIGTILGGVGIAMAVSYLPAGFLSDRFGRRPMLRLAWLLGFGATWLMALAKSLPVFVIGMTLYSFTSFVTVPLNSYITQARGNWSVGRTITLISASFNFGVILGPLIGGWVGDQYGLNRTFLIAAIIFVLSTIIMFLVSPQPVEKSDGQTETGSWKDLLNRRYFQYLVVIFFVTFSLYLPQPLSQNFLQNQRGLDLEQIGQLIATRSLGIVVINLVVGQINARLGYLIAQACMAAFTLLLLRGVSMPWYFAGYFLLGSYQTARALAIAQGRSLIQAAYMGVGYAFLETAMTAAIIIASPLAGVLYQTNPTYIYSFSLILILIAILVTKLFSPLRTKDFVKGGYKNGTNS
jgi:predicted MFS family arabinose efflux permease